MCSLMDLLPPGQKALAKINQLIQDEPCLVGNLTARPAAPVASDCCGQSCRLCVFDIFDKDEQNWAIKCLNSLKIPGYDMPSILESCESIDNLCPREYVILEIEQLNSDTFVYNLQWNNSLGTQYHASIQPGSHVVIRGITQNDTDVHREYTPLPNSTIGQCRILIKLYPNGKMAEYLRTLQVGDILQLRGPFSKLEYVTNKYKNVLLLAAGTGITPMLQLIHHILLDEDDETRLKLIYCSHNESSVYMREMLEQWSSYWNLRVKHYISSPDISSPQYCQTSNIDYGIRLTEQSLKEEIEVITENQTNGVFPNVIICGPWSFVKDMLNYCDRIGVPEENIFRF